MTTLVHEIKKGQTFTNGTTSIRFEMLNVETLLIKNLKTGKESNLSIDSHVYNLSELVAKRVYIDYNNNKVELTENEKEFIKELDEMIFESGTIVFLDTMELPYSTRVGRGVLSSLIKKNVCCECEGMIGYSMDKY
jgi:hypothetical protein